jgi:hypothetical protein
MSASRRQTARRSARYFAWMGTVHPFPGQQTVDRLLRSAIRDRRLLSFRLHGLPRRAEPHDYGIVKGVRRLFFYQVGGRSRSGTPVGWRWATVAEMEDVQLLDTRFGGAREIPSGRHVHWDDLIASVSRNVAEV